MDRRVDTQPRQIFSILPLISRAVRPGKISCQTLETTALRSLDGRFWRNSL